MKIKICGLFREMDIDFVNIHKPDYIGFVFAKSRRQISFETAITFRNRLSNAILPVGVFVDSPIDEIKKIYGAGIISIVQLHGCEDKAYIADLKKNCDMPVIKSISSDKIIFFDKTKIPTAEPRTQNKSRAEGLNPTERMKLKNTIEEIENLGADYILFDSQKAGSGYRFDWNILDAFNTLQIPYFLAGGINLENIKEACSKSPFCIDVSSGAETDGKKDNNKIKLLVESVRNNS
ncbi:MAG: phosphoribosylanthranilate isomerase [Termitinemataceae bacterium]|nr:MAG: phosphoribosylanthranilate isomerase [Termitinemataceae bacterium]